MSFKLTGGCFCGQVRYTITAPAGYTHHCHCSNCRRIHGAAFVTYSMFPRGAFSWDSDADDMGAFSTSQVCRAAFARTAALTSPAKWPPFPT
jgi:hypothetical protein